MAKHSAASSDTITHQQRASKAVRVGKYLTQESSVAGTAAGDRAAQRAMRDALNGE